MINYRPHTCNIHNCYSPEYKNHMCKEHYNFYMQNQIVRRVNAEILLLETGAAGTKLKFKRIIHSIVHHCFDYPLPLVEHFPLEHVFWAEMQTACNSKHIDVERCQKVIEDFDIPENENIAAMRRVLRIRDIETSELGAKEKYQLEKKDYPSIIPLFITVIGLSLLLVFFARIVDSDFQVRNADLNTIRTLFLQYIPFVSVFAVFVVLGLMIPNSFNYIIDRCYNMTLFKNVEDNVDIVNQVCYVKERRRRAGSYYASILGSSLASIIIIFCGILNEDTPFSWKAIVFCIGITLTIVPLLFSFSEMPLYYPVVEHLRRKRVSIDLYNADMHGGLKRYHLYLYKVFLYSEGISIILLDIVWISPFPNWLIILLILFLMPRFKHAGWAMISWIRTIMDFYREKSTEKEHLLANAGSKENIEKMSLLNKVHATGVIPLVVFLSSSVLIPILVSKLSELLNI